jgi:hypothetical protein
MVGIQINHRLSIVSRRGRYGMKLSEVKLRIVLYREMMLRQVFQ